MVGVHASHEQIPPSELLVAVQEAEAAGFGLGVSSDHAGVGEGAPLVDLLGPGEVELDPAGRVAVELEPHAHRWCGATGRGSARRRG